MRAAVDRLTRVHEARAFELWLSARALAAPALWLEGASAHLPLAGEGPVILLVGLRRRAWLGLGLLHLLAWWRVRKHVGSVYSGPFQVVITP